MLEKQLKLLKKLTNEPEIYLTDQNEKLPKIKDVLKALYDQSRSSCTSTGTALSHLILEHMDDEQIWSQLELNNEELIDQSIPSVSKVISVDEQRLELHYKRKNEESEDENGIEEEDGNEDDNEEEDEVDSDEEEIRARREQVKKAAGKTSIVDDQFFKLSEMEAFLEQEDKKAMGKTKAKDDGINYFDELETDSEEESDVKQLNYKDYFDADDGMQVDDDDADEEGGEEEEDEHENGEDEMEEKDESEDEPAEEEQTEKSTFEKRQEKLKDTIERLEERALAGRSWQLKGEIHAGARPQNALLEEYLEFDTATRPAPIITQETTMLLEDIIKQRIKDTAFDDVERKIKPTQGPQEYRKQLVLDSEKSKESLAQIYEKEYLKQAAKLDIAEEKDDEPDTHKAIRKSLTALFAKLDALSNYHFTPKPAAPDVKIITNTPAIEMEEVAPIAMSNATLLAPEEVKRRPRGEVLTTGEMTTTDKNRARRQKKIRQKVHHRLHEKRDAKKLGTEKTANEEKARLLKTVMKSRNVEAMRIEKMSKIKSSTDFFHRLNENQAIKDGTKTKKKTKQSKPTGISAKFVKL